MTLPTPITVTSTQDGQQFTVNDLLKDPTVIPRRIINMANQRFIADQLLRMGPQSPSGVAKFYSSTPLFAEDGAEVVAEYGEIPVVRNQLGQLQLALATKMGMGIRISREMADENNIDAVNLAVTQAANTMVRDWDGPFMAALVAAATGNSQVVAASAAWTVSTATPWNDFVSARQLVVNATLPGESNQLLGYEPDTLVVSTLDVGTLLQNPTVRTPYVGNIANLNPQVTGQLTNPLFGMETWVTPHLAQGTVLVLERNTVGFISDTRPLEATPMEYNQNEEHWRTNTTRKSAVGIDQPLAVAAITGVG